MKISSNLKVDTDKTPMVMGYVCVSSNEGDHFWYRNGGWEKLQPDGSYKKCDEPKVKNGYKITDYFGSVPRQYKYNESVSKSDKWEDADVITPWDFKEQGLPDTKEKP